jgi:signal transduction histidine kinase
MDLAGYSWTVEEKYCNLYLGIHHSPYIPVLSAGGIFAGSIFRAPDVLDLQDAHKFHERAIFGREGHSKVSRNETMKVAVQFGPRTPEKGELSQQLQRYQQRLKALATQLTLAEEKERRAIAADLHDHVGHSLALARMQLNAILEAKSELERTILVKDISNLLLKALQDTRNLIFDLSSPAMNEIGLAAAISEWLEEQIAKRHGLRTEFIDNIDDKHRKILDKNVRALLFRNVRELLINVVKHARAHNVRVLLTESAEGVKIVVEDDGVGFDAEGSNPKQKQTEGFGLFSIQERMTDLGGSFDIQSQHGKGCRVTLTVPLSEG